MKGDRRIMPKKSDAKVRLKPAITVEGREKQMVAYAMDLAESKLKDGTASSQLIAHFLKLGSATAELERQKLENENLLLKAKIESLQAMKSTEEAYKQAMEAMMLYRGESNEELPRNDAD